MIQRIKGCEIVAVCDQEPLMARQLAERFHIPRYFPDLRELLADSRADVVHITTPPQSHHDIAKLCLESGCHVYVEKPFALYENEAKELILLANKMQRKITAGHDDQFTHVARRMRDVVHSGFLGGTPVHMEGYYCYELGGDGYANALLGDKRHWVRRLPGKLLQNVISHGVARIAEFLQGDSPEIIAYGFVSSFLKGRGETEIIDELRVILSDNERTTAYFTFSSQMRPALHMLRIYGPKNGLVMDQDQETLIKLRGTRFPSYAEKFIPPAYYTKQFLGNLSTNLRKFLMNDFHMKSGMKYLIESFYRAIVEGKPEPIPHREILLTARIMDAIFAQLEEQQSQRKAVHGLPVPLAR